MEKLFLFQNNILQNTPVEFKRYLYEQVPLRVVWWGLEVSEV